MACTALHGGMGGTAETGRMETAETHALDWNGAITGFTAPRAVATETGKRGANRGDQLVRGVPLFVMLLLTGQCLTYTAAAKS